jgi:hypothetical protein
MNGKWHLFFCRSQHRAGSCPETLTAFLEQSNLVNLGCNIQANVFGGTACRLSWRPRR